MTVLAGLPFELLERIASCLRPASGTNVHDRSHSRDLLALASTCRALARVCRSIAHARVSIACPPCPYADATDPAPPLNTPVSYNRSLIRHLALHALYESPRTYRRVLDDLICTTAPSLVSLAATSLPDMSHEALRCIASSSSLENVWLECCELAVEDAGSDSLVGLGSVSRITNYTALFVSTQITSCLVPRCRRLKHLILRDVMLGVRHWWPSSVWDTLVTLAIDTCAPGGADEIMHVIDDLQVCTVPRVLGERAPMTDYFCIRQQASVSEDTPLNKLTVELPSISYNQLATVLNVLRAVPALRHLDILFAGDPSVGHLEAVAARLPRLERLALCAKMESARLPTKWAGDFVRVMSPLREAVLF
jgi:hypothetical protein